MNNGTLFFCLLLLLLLLSPLLLSINSLILVYYATQFQSVKVSKKKLWNIFYQQAVLLPSMKMLQKEFCPDGRGSTFMKCILIECIMKLSPETLRLILPNWRKSQNATFITCKVWMYSLLERSRLKKLDLLRIFV